MTSVASTEMSLVSMERLHEFVDLESEAPLSLPNDPRVAIATNQHNGPNNNSEMLTIESNPLLNVDALEMGDLADRPNSLDKIWPSDNEVIDFIS